MSGIGSAGSVSSGSPFESHKSESHSVQRHPLDERTISPLPSVPSERRHFESDNKPRLVQSPVAIENLRSLVPTHTLQTKESPMDVFGSTDNTSSGSISENSSSGTLANRPYSFEELGSSHPNLFSPDDLTKELHLTPAASEPNQALSLHLKVSEEEIQETLTPLIEEEGSMFDAACAQLEAKESSMFDEVLAQLDAEERSKLDTVQKIWNTIVGSNTQEIASYIMGNLPTPMRQLGMLLSLKHVFTLVLDISDGSAGDRRSARRMMVLEPEKTIDLYNSLIKKLTTEDERTIKLVTKGSDIYFETTEGVITEIESSDIITGVTVEKFHSLYSTNIEDARKLAEVVGGYVWKNASHLWTPARREAVRRIKEDFDKGITFLNDAVNLISDIYSTFNPVWAAMQAALAFGDILTTGEL